MTTIAYRDGIIAADSRTTWNGGHLGDVTKIAKNGKILAGSAGSASQCKLFLDWVLSGMMGDQPKLVADDYELDAFVALPDGKIVFFNGQSSFPLKARFYACGSGYQYALGAMSMGATAEEAVRIAAQHDTKTGGEIQTLTVT